MEREQTNDPGYLIMPDIEPFVSTVDGSVISGRAALRDHNRRHGVTNIEDFKVCGPKLVEERKQRFLGQDRASKERRIEHVKHAYEKHNRR